MPQDRLGLFDTPPDRRQIVLSIAIVCLMSIILLLLYPVRSIPLPAVNAFIPTIDAILFLGEAITATLLYAQASVFRSRALVAVATGYLLTSLLVIPHALTFPGAFAPDGLLDAGVNTTSWLAYARRWMFPIAIILYVRLKREDAAVRPGTERTPVRIFAWIVGAVVLAAAVTLLTTVGHDLLPPFFANRSDVIRSNSFLYQSVLLAAFAVAGVMLFRERRSVLDMWLLVAVSGWFVETVTIITLSGRFNVGWYGLYVLMAFTHLIVMLALLTESNRLYAQLALTTIARNRERSARLMSLDAVAAAISHEIGQPLTAIRLQAGMSRSRLASAKPEIGRAHV